MAIIRPGDMVGHFSVIWNNFDMHNMNLTKNFARYSFFYLSEKCEISEFSAKFWKFRQNFAKKTLDDEFGL